MGMQFIQKLIDAKKQATVNAFTAGEAAKAKAIKAGKLDRKKAKSQQEEAQVRELRKEAAKLREEQEQAKNLSSRMGLGEKILRMYFTYKLASLACRTLVGLAGGYARDDVGRAAGQAITTGIDRMSDELADDIMEKSADTPEQDVNNQRAEMIEQTLDSFERMSQEAAEQGLTPEDRPLLNDDDREKIQSLADISRDVDDPQQAERYAATCRDLGLDYNEAMTAFQQDKTFDTVQRDVELQQEKDSPSMELEM